MVRVLIRPIFKHNCMSYFGTTSVKTHVHKEGNLLFYFNPGVLSHRVLDLGLRQHLHLKVSFHCQKMRKQVSTEYLKDLELSHLEL